MTGDETKFHGKIRNFHGIMYRYQQNSPLISFAGNSVAFAHKQGCQMGGLEYRDMENASRDIRGTPFSKCKPNYNPFCLQNRKIGVFISWIKALTAIKCSYYISKLYFIEQNETLV